ncbi:FabD/lysophospholipase-like protein [Setomelanomma holmii]|uniref:FabD/lysophospholipase-like protein n=1 Tax=Setomelanomma holmii TaxID=210430 RepID=A0A9P4GTU3_9PLEO|nr:FabD/lysophospholipase-like protein [Setomelanomma holmii]
MPIQEHFDLSFGTSSGSMVNMALYGLGMPLDDVYNLFKTLSERIFRGRNPFGIGFAAAAHALVSSYYYGQFPSADIDGVLRELLGDTTMLDNSYTMSIGARIGFPIVNVPTLQTCVATSYNGVGKAPEACYRVLRSGGPSDEISIRDAYFTPHAIPGHGTFYDGELSDHNPGTLMLQELRRLDPNFSCPDQLVSVGTGVCKSDHTETEAAATMRVNSLYQTYHHYLQYNFNGIQQFEKMRDMIKVSTVTQDKDVDQWIRRFDLPVEGPPADLADPAAIDSLGAAAWAYFAPHPEVHNLARSIIASTFYFQLRQMPVYE